MIHTPHTFTPLQAPLAQPAAHCFVFRQHEVLLRDADLALPDAHTLAALNLPRAQTVPVGLFDAQYCEAAWVEASTEAPAGHAFQSMRSLFGVVDDGWLGVAGRAYQLAEWARTHRFCGACGTPMTPLAGERCMRCAACGHGAYPRISPAMMVLIRRGDALLLARHAAHANARYTALAGFLEAGESIEDAVHREVFEEVGLQVRDLRYFASQSWPFPHSLMIAFTAEYAGGEIRVDPNEITEARWFGPADPWPEIPGDYSVAAALVKAHRPQAR